LAPENQALQGQLKGRLKLSVAHVVSAAEFQGITNATTAKGKTHMVPRRQGEKGLGPFVFGPSGWLGSR
jgi:hypothetical protein